MKRLLSYLIALIFAICLGLVVVYDPGYVLFYLNHWTVEMPFWLAILVLVIIVWLVHFVWRLIYNMFHYRGVFRSWHKHRRLHRSHSDTGDGLIALAKGHAKKAERLLVAGAILSKSPLVNHLSAAKAAAEQGAIERSQQHLETAEEQHPQEKLMINLVRAELQIKQERWEAALTTLEMLYDHWPKNKVMLDLLKKSYITLNRWSSLLKILPDLRKQEVISEAENETLSILCYQHLLEKPLASFDRLNDLWASIPRNLRQEKSLIRTYVLALCQKEEDDQALSELETHLKKHWDPDLLDLLCNIRSSKPQKTLQIAEAYLKHHADDVSLARVLVKLSIRNKNWDAAEQHLKNIIKKQAQSQDYQQLGFVKQQQGNIQAALQAYQQGFECAK